MEERVTRGKAIRLKCLDCCCGNAAEVRLCQLRRYPLWRFRMGREALAEIGGDRRKIQGNNTE